MSKQVTAELLQDVLNQSIGKTILQSFSGDTTGSIFTMAFGTELIRRESKGYVFHEGEMSLMVYCAWRLVDINNEIITGWHEDSSENGPLTLGLKGLVGDIIETIKVSQNFDLTITSAKGKRLEIFCDLTPNTSMNKNWFFGINDIYYSIDNALHCIQSLH